MKVSAANLLKRMYAHKYVYLLVLPLAAFYIIFSYIPMYGISLAFKTFNYSLGITGSPWNNFQNFKEVLTEPLFFRAFRNTCLISLGRLVIEFPIPIVLALLLNEISKYRLKRIYQTIFTFPHFLSWVIMSGILINMLSDRGVVNQILEAMGKDKNRILMEPVNFVALVFGSNIWKEAGWSTILYLASIAGINPELYEAATVDGANRWQQVWVITWPTIQNTALILLILAVGNTMNGGFDQIFNMYNPTVFKYGDIIDTYVYRSAFRDSTGFGFTTTVGFMKSIVNFALLFGANKVVRLMGSEGLL
ncbi:MAG: ABC transporter permease subunit [Treponema sp.]|jgi:putative aldouronate transport system permease protein|nr:ABC transporter permease subunit [Treponema sp.]